MVVKLVMTPNGLTSIAKWSFAEQDPFLMNYENYYPLRCVCMCKIGYTGDKCQHNIDDCANIKCENGGKCHDLMGSYSCECPIGFAGPLCEELR